MRIATWNLNGLRAAWRNGLAGRLGEVGADVWLLQEVRCTPEQEPPEVAAGLREAGYGHRASNPAEKLGYAGTAVWAKRPLADVRTGLSPRDADPEGRVVAAGVGGVTLASVYLPSGSSGEHRQAVKEAWMRRFRPWATKMLARDEPVLLAGDLNIAMTPRDIYYAKGNEKNSGYLPHERAWMARLVKSGWRDLVREAYGDVDGPYTWWSNRGQARKLDRGWRIDYALANPAAAALVTGVTVHRDASLGVSDHAPVSVDLRG